MLIIIEREIMIENFILLGAGLFVFSFIAVVGEVLARAYAWD